MNLAPKPLIQVNPTKGSRYYLNEEKPSFKYASVTAILAATQSEQMKKASDFWRQSLIKKGEDPTEALTKAARRGSDIHQWADDWLSVRDPDMPSYIAPWCHYIKKAPLWKHVDEVLCTEQQVCSDQGIYPFAGTFDALLKIKGETVLFDFKTKNPEKKYPTKDVSDEALCQMQAYRMGLREGHGIEVDRFIAFYVFPDQPTYPVSADKKALDKYEKMWNKRLTQYAKQQEQNNG